MNKAFVREPEDDGRAACPRCGSVGTPMGEETIARRLAEPLRRQLAATGFFCPFARCEVVYFDIFERVIELGEVDFPVYPKDPTAPICACFGLTEADIEADVREGVPRRVREVLDKARSSAAQCSQRSASGQSCVAEVQKCYLRMRDGEAGTR